MSSKTYQRPLMCSMLFLCAGNALALWRLATREEDLERDAWPGLSRYARHLRDTASFEVFLLKMALGVLERDGHLPSVHAPAAAATVDAASAHADAEFEVLRATLANIRCGSSRRAWFKSEQGKRFRVFSSPKHKHRAVPLTRQKWCAFSKTEFAADAGDQPTYEARKRKRRRVGHRAMYRCAMCGVNLCQPTTRNGMRDCFAAWHQSNTQLP